MSKMSCVCSSVGGFFLFQFIHCYGFCDILFPFFVLLLFSRSGSLIVFVLKLSLLLVCIVSIVVIYSPIFCC